MRTAKKIFLSFMLVYSLLCAVLFPAQINYTLAVKAAMKTDRTDASIERAMYRHGFIVDAYNTEEPTTFEKVKALFNQPQ
jgi:hypothetical protein